MKSRLDAEHEIYNGSLEGLYVPIYLQWQVRDETCDSKYHQQKVGKSKGPCGVCDLLNLPIRFSLFLSISAEINKTKLKNLAKCYITMLLVITLNVVAPLANN